MSVTKTGDTGTEGETTVIVTVMTGALLAAGEVHIDVDTIGAVRMMTMTLIMKRTGDGGEEGEVKIDIAEKDIEITQNTVTAPIMNLNVEEEADAEVKTDTAETDMMTIQIIVIILTRNAEEGEAETDTVVTTVMTRDTETGQGGAAESVAEIGLSLNQIHLMMKTIGHEGEGNPVRKGTGEEMMMEIPDIILLQISNVQTERKTKDEMI